ncbi:aldolase/citrate lyase family protein [Nocardioides sp. NBC_00163]|uniref:HpcH/HpaI aldolase family protein n=1 Tax=Nocardioides sp. NBC_00163 TaxID=2975999 RepID=UPI003255F20B
MTTHLREVLSFPALGTFAKIGHRDVIEVLAIAGLDFVIIDMEHAALGPAEVHALVGAALGSGLPPLVRVPDHDATTIARVLDSGAHGVLVPHVSTAEQAERLLEAARLPPNGRRGYGPTVRAGRYGSDPDAYRKSAELALVIPQIEDPEGVENCSAIAATGVGHLFVGMADLAVTAGLETSDPALTDMLRHVDGVARRHDIVLGTAVSAAHGPTAPAGLDSASFLAVSNDASLLLERARALATV